MSVTPEHIEEIVANHTDWFEQSVLAAALTLPDFVKQFGSVICPVKPPKPPEDDFVSPIDNVLFRACRDFHDLMSLNKDATDLRPDMSFIYAAIKHAVSESLLLPDDEVPAFQRAQQCAALDMTPYKETLARGVPIWLEKVRVRKNLFKHRKGKKLSSESVIADIRASISDIQSISHEQYRYRAVEGLDVQTNYKARHPTSLSGLNTILGGGLAFGESTMIVAPEGAGKTLLGLMLHCDLAIDNGLPGLFVSTEQGNTELLPRMVSARCDIPFKDIVDGVHLNRLKTAQQRMDVMGLVQMLDKSRVLEWKRGKTRSIVGDMEREIDIASEEMGTEVKYVIFDWLGRGAEASALTTEDFKYIRHLYQQSADYMADLARRRNIIMILFMQATMKLALNKPRVDATMIGECKSAGANQTQVLGVSAMMTNMQEVQLNSASPSYTAKQFLFASKTRKAGGHLMPIGRMFEYQKFVDWKTRELDSRQT